MGELMLFVAVWFAAIPLLVGAIELINNFPAVRLSWRSELLRLLLLVQCAAAVMILIWPLEGEAWLKCGLCLMVLAYSARWALARLSRRLDRSAGHPSYTDWDSLRSHHE